MGRNSNPGSEKWKLMSNSELSESPTPGIATIAGSRPRCIVRKNYPTKYSLGKPNSGQGKPQQQILPDTEAESSPSRLGHSKIYYYPKLLGFGKTSVVFEGYFASPERRVAVKQISLKYYAISEPDCRMWKQITADVNILKYYKHVFHNNTDVLSIAMELADTTFTTSVKRHDSRTTIRKYLQDVALGLQWLHDRKVTHRNVKPDNIYILNAGKTAKLGEFGITKIFNINSEQSDSLGRGVYDWKSPEQISACSNEIEIASSWEQDVFSFGLTICYGLSGGKHLFGSGIFRGVNILQGKIGDVKTMLVNESTLIPFILKMVHSNPAERPSMDVVIKMLFTD